MLLTLLTLFSDTFKFKNIHPIKSINKATIFRWYFLTEFLCRQTEQLVLLNKYQIIFRV